MNRYNDQQALARQVADLLRKPGGRNLFRGQVEHFRDWNARWETENADYLKRYQELETRIVRTFDKTGLDIARKRSKLKRQRDQLEPSGPSPWERLLAIPQYSEDEHSTDLLGFFVPTEAIPSSAVAEALCLQCVRLAILHDGVQCHDGTYQSIIGDALNPDEARYVWHEMTSSWASWSLVLADALKDVAIGLARHPDEEEAGPDAQENRQEGKPRGSMRKRQSGRQPLSKREANKRQKILAAWGQAERAGIKRGAFCKSQDIEVSDLEKYQAWGRQRKART